MVSAHFRAQFFLQKPAERFCFTRSESSFGHDVEARRRGIKQKKGLDSKNGMKFVHFTSASPPFQRQWTPESSSAIVLEPWAAGCCRNCVRADHQGVPHKKTAHNAASANNGTTLTNVVWWSVARVSSPMAGRRKMNTNSRRKVHFDTKLRCR